MGYKRKTWSEKFSTSSAPKIEVTDKAFADVPAGARMLIATPAIFDSYIKQIPKGKSVELSSIRKDLAAEYHADYTCPITSGIFLRIVAEKAWEEYQKGKPLNDISPFWRAIDLNSPTAKKLSFGMDFILEQRNREGIESHLPKTRMSKPSKG